MEAARLGGQLHLERATLHLPHLRPHGRIDGVGLAVRAVDPQAEVELDGGLDFTRLEQPVLLPKRIGTGVR